VKITFTKRTGDVSTTRTFQDAEQLTKMPAETQMAYLRLILNELELDFDSRMFLAAEREARKP
jgi:hypothetical protein